MDLLIIIYWWISDELQIAVVDDFIFVLDFQSHIAENVSNFLQKNKLNYASG